MVVRVSCNVTLRLPINVIQPLGGRASVVINADVIDSLYGRATVEMLLDLHATVKCDGVP